MPFTPLVYTANYWAEMLAAAASDLPTARLVAWIAEETGGNPCGLGAPTEVGIFQIDMQDGPVAGGSVDTLHGNFSTSPLVQTRARSLTPDEEALQVSTGIKYVRSCLARAKETAPTWSDTDIWCLTKMVHCLPAMVSQFFPQAAAAGHATSWDDYQGYARSLKTEQFPKSVQRYVYKFWGPRGIFPNCERVGAADGSTPDGTGTSGGLPVGACALDLISTLAIVALAAITYFFTR
jgi:hypothetical protein